MALASLDSRTAHGRYGGDRCLQLVRIRGSVRSVHTLQRPVRLHFLLRRLCHLLDLILGVNHRLLFRLHTATRLAPLTAPRHHRLRFQVREEVLAYHLDDVAPHEVNSHRCAQPELERVCHLNDLQPAVQLGHEVGGTGERDSACTQEAIPERLVLANTFAEGTTLPICQYTVSSVHMKTYLEIDRKRRYLLRQAQQVDSRVQQAWLELGLEIYGARPGLVDT